MSKQLVKLEHTLQHKIKFFIELYTDLPTKLKNVRQKDLTSQIQLPTK